MHNHLTWSNPRTSLWGFHVHQELPQEDFVKSLAIQNQCAAFLSSHNIPIDADDAIAPGYGPHLDYMWELRVESAATNVLEKLGLAISYMAVNRFGLSAYIHPLMHDTSLSDEEALAAEGRLNQHNALWFSRRVPQAQEFFFNPPKDEQQKIIDTRTSRIMSAQKRTELLDAANTSLPKQCFREPKKVILRGFHIHMDYTLEQESLALAIFDQFLLYLIGENLRPTSTRLYAPRENGPHIQGGWEVKFETRESSILSRIGIAIAWLMCNRHNMSVFMHPVTWEEGDRPEELRAHKEYAFFLGHLPELDLTFFE